MQTISKGYGNHPLVRFIKNRLNKSRPEALFLYELLPIMAPMVMSWQIDLIMMLYETQHPYITPSSDYKSIFKISEW